MIPSAVRIFLSTEPIDMRRGFDRLAQLVLLASLAELLTAQEFYIGRTLFVRTPLPERTPHILGRLKQYTSCEPMLGVWARTVTISQPSAPIAFAISVAVGSGSRQK